MSTLLRAGSPLGYPLRLLRSSDTAFGVVLAVAVGAAAALGALAFVNLAAFFNWLIFNLGGLDAGVPGGVYTIFAPAIGGLIIGPLWYFFARENRGHGLPNIMLAVARRGGRVRVGGVAAKMLAAAICLGSGGSVGRVGPIIQLGAGLGSGLGQLLRLPDERLRLLVACGGAAGVSATFNAPIAGVFFALEALLREFGARSFSLVVLSSVTGTVVTRAIVGDNPAFVVPPYSLVSAWEIGLYFLLGLACALVAVLFIRLFYATWDLFEALRMPEYLKPAVGGLLVGLIGFAFPQIYGGGFPEIEAALGGGLPLQLLLLLVPIKMLATSLSLGSAGSGGVFAPTLFIGAMLGGGFGHLVHGLLPDLTATSGAYALVGMAALFGACANAPITAVLIVFEMTNDYHIILPLMACTGVAALVAHRLEPESIYTMKIRRMGHDLRARVQPNLMQAVTVKEAMKVHFETVPASLPFSELAERLMGANQRGLPVLDERGELHGVVTLSDVERAMARADARDLTAGDVATKNVITAYPQETLHEALSRLAGTDAGYLPVVDPSHPGRVVGLLSRADIIGAYSSALARQAQLDLDLQRLRIGNPAGTRFLEYHVREHSPLAARRVKDLALPADCLVVSLRRGGEIKVPHGDTRILPGDHLLIFCLLPAVPALQRYLGDEERR